MAAAPGWGRGGRRGGPHGDGRWREWRRRDGGEWLAGLGSSRRRRRAPRDAAVESSVPSAVGERGLGSPRWSDRQAKLPDIISLERVEAGVVDALAPAVFEVAVQA